MLRLSLILIFGWVLVACQSIETKRPELSNPAPAKPNGIPKSLKPNDTVTSTDVPVNNNLPSSVTAAPEMPNAPVVTPPNVEGGDRVRIGVILGAGGLRAYAHIGVLQELLKSKLPIVSVVGFETGALVGGIYSAKGQMYDVEWQMEKLHSEDFQHKSLMNDSKPQDIRVLSSFLQNALGNIRAEDAKVSFACPSYNLAKHQVFMMSRGPMTSMLPYCVPFSPFYKPYDQSVAALTSLSAAIKYMKSKGVNYVVYVDLLNEKSTPFFADTESQDNVEWATIAEALQPQLAGVNKVISVPLKDFYINDFSKRREMSQHGQDAGRAAGKEIMNELGL